MRRLVKFLFRFLKRLTDLQVASTAFEYDGTQRLPRSCMVMVLAETGLRASEVCTLELKDLFLDQRYLVVLGKGSRWKLCRLSRETVNILNLWLGYRRDLWTDAKTVFVSVRGKKRNLPMDRFGLLTTFRRISSEVSFYFTPNVFRRLMATRMLELGATEEAVKQQGDWRSDRDFRQYIKTYRLREVEPYSPVSSFAEMMIIKSKKT